MRTPSTTICIIRSKQMHAWFFSYRFFFIPLNMTSNLPDTCNFVHLFPSNSHMTQGLVVEFTFACSLLSSLNLLLLLLVCLPLLPHSCSFLLSLSSYRAFRWCIGIFVFSERFHTSWQQHFRGDVAPTKWAFFHCFPVGSFVLHNVRLLNTRSYRNVRVCFQSLRTWMWHVVKQ